MSFRPVKNAVNTQISRRKVGWVSAAALGVAIVVAGDYIAWNFGLAAGGWGGMAIAVLLGAGMYLALSLCMAELGSMYPSEAGAVEFVRRGFGETAAAVAGWCVIFEFIGAGAAIASFFGAYGYSVVGVAPADMIAALFVGALALQLLGARDVLWITQAMTVVAIVGILLTLIFLLGTLSERPFHPIELMGSSGASLLTSAWAAVPYAVAMFLGIEGIALTAGEVRQPSRNIPRALVAALGTQCALVVSLILIVPSTVDGSELARIGDPIAFAWRSIGIAGGRAYWGKLCLGCALSATATSFFSVMFAYSRQVHAFAREGFLPSVFAQLSRRRAPIFALAVPSIAAYALGLFCSAELLIVMCVFGATASYLLMFAAHLRLRYTAPSQPRTYRAPGNWVAVLGIGLTIISFLACMRSFRLAAALTGVAIAALSLYSDLRSRKCCAAAS